MMHLIDVLVKKTKSFQILSPRGSSIGCEPRFMKQRSQVRILAWTCQKKKKKKFPNSLFLFFSSLAFYLYLNVKNFTLNLGKKKEREREGERVFNCSF
jgi:hypothetical protein